MPYDRRPSEGDCKPMSETAPDPDLPRSREERRLLARALGCALEESIARFGAKHAIRCVQAELRRARRARSRKLYSFWSAMLARIETEMEQRQETPRQESKRLERVGGSAEGGARTFRFPRRGRQSPKDPIAAGAAAAVLSTGDRDRFVTRRASPRR
jgi:hypothetical protein